MAKTIFYSLAALVRKILFCHSKIKFISSRHRVISSIYSLYTNVHALSNYLVDSFYIVGTKLEDNLKLSDESTWKISFRR